MHSGCFFWPIQCCSPDVFFLPELISAISCHVFIVIMYNSIHAQHTTGSSQNVISGFFARFMSFFARIMGFSTRFFWGIFLIFVQIIIFNVLQSFWSQHCCRIVIFARMRFFARIFFFARKLLRLMFPFRLKLQPKRRSRYTKKQPEGLFSLLKWPFYSYIWKSPTATLPGPDGFWKL